MGFISPVTGPDAAFATANPFVLKKVREAFAKGLTIGGKKYTVEIFTADSQSSDFTRAAQVAPEQLITQNNMDIMLTTSAPETVNPVSDQCEAAHVPCIGTIVPWRSWFLGRSGKIGTTAATSTSFKYTYLLHRAGEQLAAQGPGWKLIPTKTRSAGCGRATASGRPSAAPGPSAAPQGYTVYDPAARRDDRLHLHHRRVQGAQRGDRLRLPTAAGLPDVLEPSSHRGSAADRRHRQGAPTSPASSMRSARSARTS